MSARRRVLALALLAATVAGVYLPSLRNGFVWDDGQNVVANPHLAPLDGALVAWAFGSFRLGHYQPLTWLSLALDRAIWGLSPAGFHLTNLWLHLANALIFFGLARRLGCRVVGVDQSPEMLAEGRGRVEAAGLGGRIELREGRAEALPFEDGSFAGLTLTYLLRYVEDPAATMRELVRVVRPGGRVAMLEFAVPRRPLPPRSHPGGALCRRRARTRTAPDRAPRGTSVPTVPSRPAARSGHRP